MTGSLLLALMRRAAHARAWLRTGGIILLLSGLQGWAFNRATVPLVEEAGIQLAALQQEVTDNRLANLALEALQDYWNTVDDELTKRQVLELRDTVVQRFITNPAGAVAELARVTAGLDASSLAEEEALATLQRRVQRLAEMYADKFAAARAAYTRPAWYLQPTAGLLNDDRARAQALAFNHALYLLAVRDASGALAILDELREAREFESGYKRARLLYALARLQLQAFQLERDPAYFRESLQYAQQSARADADYGMPKVFLDYLLSIDRQAAQVDMAPLEGEGSGEGEGERGAIVTDPEDF